MIKQIWENPSYLMAKTKAQEPNKPKPPSPRSIFAARLVSIGQGDPPGKEWLKEREDRLKKKWPATPDSERLGADSADRSEAIDKRESHPPNLGPNTTDRAPQRFGLLDFQDIALFLWPPYRQRKRPFNTSEQCIILRHRNSRLSDLTQVELVETQAWMERSEEITVEDKEVNMRDWRINLDEENLRDLVQRMEEDLKRAESISTYAKPIPPEPSSKEKPTAMATPPRTPSVENPDSIGRTQRLAAKRRIVNDDSD